MQILCAALVVVWSAALAVTGAADDRPGPAGVFPNEKVTAAEQERVFRLLVPKSVDRTRPAPLVVAFHGMLVDSKDVMPAYTKLDKLAADKEFLIAFPNAVDRAWGIDPKKVAADLQFFDALLREINRRYHVDSRRVYVVGMSNGGYFAHLVGKERSTKVAAVCSHSGPLGLQTIAGIRAKRKFPVMIVHGADDKLFPIQWARDNRDKYRREGHAVNYVEVPKLGHFWAVDPKVNINDQIWTFFKANPLPK